MIETFFNVGIVRAAWPILLAGLGMTLALSALVVPLGLLGGLVLALLSTVRSRWVRLPLIAWIDFFRAFPPLVLLIFLYAGLPFAGLEMGGFGCVAVGFFLNTGAYYGEVLRAGIDSVPAGQTEAARTLGLGRWQALGLVVLPQAVRNVLPDLLSNTLEVVKLTSLASVESWRAVGAGTYELTVPDPRLAAPEVARRLVGVGADVLSLREAHHSLEDVYLELISEDVEARRP